MKCKVLILVFSLLELWAYAQKPVVKVDINMEGRSNSEVNEPGYSPWTLGQNHTTSTTVNGITFTLTAISSSSEATFRSGWSKSLIMAPYYLRLTGDGASINNEFLIAHPEKKAAIEMSITGLPVGKHLLQTFHNIWEDTTKVSYCPINVYLNGKLIYSKVHRSVMAKTKEEATVLLTELNVTRPGEKMTLLIEADKKFIPSNGKKADYNVCLNGFELNTGDPTKQAYNPIPANEDLHTDADNGTLTLTWKPAIDNQTRSQILYLDTDSITVANANSSNSPVCKGIFPVNVQKYKADGLYNLNTYYWRVDQINAKGETTIGKVWSFRPRHLAFKGAEGYGRFAIGGRGGKVVYVTNLNDEGPGSFRDAVTNGTGPRTVLFNVSGIIDLKSRVVINPNITIAGQTAPGKGICFREAPVGVSSDCVCRFIRVRLGAGKTYDGLGMAGVDNGIIDHCSISWTLDEAFSSRNAKNITLQNTLISEALNIAGHKNYAKGKAHGYAGSIGGNVGSFHHNLIAHCEGRNWSMAGGLDGNGFYAGKLDLFNNVVYNWGTRACDGGAHEVNFVGNYYKKGAATTQNIMLKAELEGTGKGSQSYFISGNIVENTDGSLACNGTDNTCARKYVLTHGQVLNWDVFVNKPFFPSYANVQTAKDAYKSVLSNVGCNMPLFDDHDKRMIKETMTGTYTYKGHVEGIPGLIDHQDDAGGYENYPEETRPDNFDSDKDGLPDWWEQLHGTNPHSPKGDFSDANTDPEHDGYTNLDDYLQWMSVPHFFLKENITTTIDLSSLTSGYINKPTFSTVSAKNVKVNYNGSVATVTPITHTNGISYLDFKVTDADGSSMTRTIGLCIGTDPKTLVQE
jgi:hypothetical protein